MADFWTDEIKRDEPIAAIQPLQNNSKFIGGLTTISPTGSVSLTDVKVGGQTLQYTIQNAGYFTFGDGSDGDVVLTANTTLTADKYYKNLTINGGVTLNPAGYRIFVSEKATVMGTISGNGNNGGNGVRNGVNGTDSLGGAALADGYLKGSLAGGNGSTTRAGAGDNGANTSNSLGSNGAAGGSGYGSAASTGGTVTASNVKLVANWHLMTLLDIGSTGATLKFGNSASAGGGGAGSLTPPTEYDSGGGAGSAGRIVAIYARNIVIGTSGSITANGGNGGNGLASEAARGSGGGGGGNGGQMILVYNVLSNNGSITATAGTGGSAGDTGATAGSNGSAGKIYQFQVSL